MSARAREKRLANFKGMSTSSGWTTEARKEALNTSILEEKLKKPVLTREWMRFWFEKFRKGD